jgi:signal peptide peptidase SppA
MRFQRIAAALYDEPALITAAAHEQIRTIFERRAAGFDIDEMFQPADPAPAYTIENGVAIFAISGVISREISRMEKTSGAIDTNAIINTAEAIKADPLARAVVLRISSPGGGVYGVQEAAEAIQSMGKPTIAHVSTIGASAAYWLASAADLIYSDPSADVGSIGVYSYRLDVSKRMEKEGYKPELFVSEGSPLKAAGAPGIPLSDEQRAYMQERVDSIAEDFRSYVQGRRKMIQPGAFSGGVYGGKKAVELGLVDALASLNQAKRDAMRMTLFNMS